MTTRRPKISVIITCFNYGRFLEQAVNSVVTQYDVNWEVVIADDASTDSSWEIAQRLADRHESVHVRRNATNRGMIPTVNDVLDSVDGDYVVKLDADDMLTPGSLERSLALLEAKPSVSFVYGNPIMFSGKLPKPRTHVRGWQVWLGREWIETRCRRTYNCIAQPEAIIRTSALREVGHYTPQLHHTSDLEMWLRLASVGDVGRIRGADQGYYRIHAQSMQRTVNSGEATDLRERYRAFESFCTSQRGLLGGADDLLTLAGRHLAEEAVGLACSAVKHGQLESRAESEFISLALEIYPAVRDSAVWREWSIRRRPDGRTGRDPLLVWGPLRRKWESELAGLRWRNSGL